MGRAAPNAGCAMRLWEPQANAREEVCREPVLRFVKHGVGSFFTTSLWHLVRSFEHNASNVNRPLEDWFPFVSRSPRQQVRSSGVAATDCTIVKSRGLLEHPETSLLWETSEYSAVKHLPQVFVVHLCQCQFGSLSGRASRPIMERVDPHHLLRVRKSVIQVVDTARVLVGSMRRLTALARCRVIQPVKLCSSSLMTFACAGFPVFGPVRTTLLFLHRCTRSDVSGFREICHFVKLELRLSACFNRDGSGLQRKGCRGETLPCGMRQVCPP